MKYYPVAEIVVDQKPCPPKVKICHLLGLFGYAGDCGDLLGLLLPGIDSTKLMVQFLITLLTPPSPFQFLLLPPPLLPS